MTPCHKIWNLKGGVSGFKKKPCLSKLFKIWIKRGYLERIMVMDDISLIFFVFSVFLPCIGNLFWVDLVNNKFSQAIVFFFVQRDHWFSCLSWNAKESRGIERNFNSNSKYNFISNSLWNYANCKRSSSKSKCISIFNSNFKATFFLKLLCQNPNKIFICLARKKKTQLKILWEKEKYTQDCQEQKHHTNPENFRIYFCTY